jgi:hypothetical protein
MDGCPSFRFVVLSCVGGGPKMGRFPVKGLVSIFRYIFNFRSDGCNRTGFKVFTVKQKKKKKMFLDGRRETE